MLIYILKRMMSLLVSLIVASILIFVVIEIIPGDPAAFMMGLNASPEAIDALREQLGLNASLISRYSSWVWSAAR
jgi:peptide/nickel transport system permease protein